MTDTRKFFCFLVNVVATYITKRLNWQGYSNKKAGKIFSGKCKKGGKNINIG